MWNSVFSVFVLSSILGIFPTEGLDKNGERVITKVRVVPLLEKYEGSSWRTDWECEKDFNDVTCDLIRSGITPISDVYVLTEKLTCEAGWTTNLPTDKGCTANCIAGWYGENCGLRCKCLYGANCHPFDGSCDCLDGWKGHDCTTRCTTGEYGPGCRNRAKVCENGGVNHPATGDCLCSSTYRGDRCQERCDPAYDEDCQIDCELCTSLNADVCDPIVGSCRCRHGWRGTYCTEPCPAGFQGVFCRDSCCSGKGFCDEVNSRCHCLGGFTGSNCSEICPNGYFGRDCLQKCPCPSCNHVTGTCESCPPGYSGDLCTERCTSNKWGPNCDYTCKCKRDEMCDVITGQCEGTLSEEDDGESSNEDEDSGDGGEGDAEDTSDTRNDEDKNHNDEIQGVVVPVSVSLLGLIAVVAFIAVVVLFMKKRGEDRKKTHFGDRPESTLQQEATETKRVFTEERPYAHGFQNHSVVYTGNINDYDQSQSPPPYDCAPPEYYEIGDNRISTISKDIGQNLEWEHNIEYQHYYMALNPETRENI